MPILRISISAWCGLCLLASILPGKWVRAENERIHTLPGFRAEVVYRVPLATQGSWVSITVDGRGRLIASDERGSLYRITPAPLAAPLEQTRVERLAVALGSAQGLLFHQGSLYVMKNQRDAADSSGLYRARDTNGDDRFDQVEWLCALAGSGEHGPHAIVAAADGKSLWICAGNHTALPTEGQSVVPAHWGEDQLLPRLDDPQGHEAGLPAPGAWVARIDLTRLDEKRAGGNPPGTPLPADRLLTLVSVGYRNPYDLAVNAAGECFTFDADMEWDISTPWYRPTRVCHVVDGSDYGWRAGNGKWPACYPDTLPPVVDVGPGSPTGLTFGTGTHFPPPYQQALFASDWSYGNLYAIHLQPEGATYRGQVELFATAMPLAVTDLVVRPQDGALYFIVGGRHTESVLYRIVVDDQSENHPASTIRPPANQEIFIEPDQASKDRAAAARKRRQRLERLQRPAGSQTADVLDELWPALSDPDRFIRHAARIALEWQPVSSWSERALAMPVGTGGRTALLGLVRAEDSAFGQTRGPAIAAALLANDWQASKPDERLEIVRIAQLLLLRMQLPEPSRGQLRRYFQPHFPSGHFQTDRQLSHLLVSLQAPRMVPRLLQCIERSISREQQIAFALALCEVHTGWQVEQREQLLRWFTRMASEAGAESFHGYLVRARDRFIAGIPAVQQGALAVPVAEALNAQPGTWSEAAPSTRPTVQKWSLEELLELESRDSGPRDLERGEKMFAAATCHQCHRLAGLGTALGPDLTGIGRRFQPQDLLRAIVEPNDQILDQYRQRIFEVGGRMLVGRILNLDRDAIYISTNMLDPKGLIRVRRDQIDNQMPSDVSLMPTGLLDTLQADEILDLLAFLRSSK